MKTKTYFFGPFLVLFAAMTIGAYSSDRAKGGDVMEIYVNGQLAIRQFIHIDKSTKTLQLATPGNNDKIDVYYSHCGTSGKERALLIKDEKNVVIKKWRFPDVNSNRSAMRLSAKELSAAIKNSTNVHLFYSAKELSGPIQLVKVNWKAFKDVAKH